MNILRCAQGR